MTSLKIAPTASAMVGVAVLAGIGAIGPGSLRAAERATRMISALTLEGRCQKLVVDGENHSSECASQLINMSYAKGRTGFYFGTRDGTIIVFSSNGNEQKKLTADSVTTPVDKLLVTHGGSVREYAAHGSCLFGNPNVRPVTISCTALSQSGISSGRFLSNLQAPKMATFDGPRRQR